MGNSAWKIVIAEIVGIMFIGVPYLFAETVYVPATNNLYGAGHAVAPAPGGAGGGLLPTQVSIPPGASYFTISTLGAVSPYLNNFSLTAEGGVGGIFAGGCSNLSYGGIAGLVHSTRGFFLSGIFLDNSEPTNPAPPPLTFNDVSASASLISANLRQSFFIGDGLTGVGSGNTQMFAIPFGARRLYLGFMDSNAYGQLPGAYSDNRGQLTVTVTFGSSLSPAVLLNPQSLVRTQANSASFTVSATGTAPLFFQWWKDGVKLTGQNGLTLNIASVSSSDAGYYWAVATNIAGSVTSAQAKLTVLAVGDKEQPEAGLVSRPAGKDSLVVVTHGWQARELNVLPPLDVPWVTEMTNAITDYLSGGGTTNWHIVGYRWTLAAWTWLPDTALIDASVLGVLFGKQAGEQGWNHVHLIGHSAGSAFINAAAMRIKQISPSTEVHTTFLDPYLGLRLAGRGTYGDVSDWSDNYFAKDLTGIFTEGKLDYSHNIDVTWLDTNKITVPKMCEVPGAISGGTLMSKCGDLAAASSHGWPHDFYLKSITNGFPTYSAYGFSRSKEAGGWITNASYQVGNIPTVLDGPFDFGVTAATTTQNPALDMTSLPQAASGNVTVLPNSLILATSATLPIQARGAKPQGASSEGNAWISMSVTVTNAANAVIFDAMFIGNAQAEGLLSVYWDTNEVGIMDERVSGADQQNCTLALPFVEFGGSHALGFRLDSYSATNSNLVITNIRTAWIQSPAPTLAMSIETNLQLPQLTLGGFPGAAYLVESSTNLVDWEVLGVFSSSNATMRYTDPSFSTNRQRFYRASPW